MMTKAKHILVVDDDPLMTRSLAFNLQRAGYQTSIAANASEAFSLLNYELPDAILLDIGLPDMDGLEALQTFQKRINAPIIFVTARRRELDEILGLTLGADDYITKPFDMDVLIARIKTVLRRTSQQQERSQPILEVGEFLFDPEVRLVKMNGQKLDLPPKQFDLLWTLAREANRVVSVDHLLLHVWGSDWIGETQTVYVHIRWLRERIEVDPNHPRRLLTIKGGGYKLVVATE